MLNIPRIMHTGLRHLAPVLAVTVLSALLPFQATAVAGHQRVDKVRQAGAFHKWENALALSEDIQKAGKKAFIMEKTIGGKVFYAVLESEQGIKESGKPPTAKEQGYEQVGAFLNRQNAEEFIISLRQQGAITFHCMKKVNEKVYYKVYQKIGVMNSSPCTLETAVIPQPTAVLKPNASTAPPPPASVAAAKASQAAEQSPIAREAMDTGAPTDVEYPETGMINTEGTEDSPKSQGTYETPKDMEPEAEAMTGTASGARFIVNTTADAEISDIGLEGEEPAAMKSNGEEPAETLMTSALESEDGEPEEDLMAADLEKDLQIEDSLVPPETGEEAKGGYQALPSTGPLPLRPPITQATGEVVLDSSPIIPIDDNRHFYIKPDAVVFTERNQFGSWYANFNEFDAGMVTGQSNKWYIVRFREGITGYVQKADTVEYVLPYENEELYK